MAAYAAVASLSQTLDAILHSDGLPTSLNRRQLESLHEKISLLKQFLENQEASHILESKIRDAACEAEDLIETHMVNLPELGIGQIENRMRSLMFSAVKNVVAFVLVQNLCHFAAKRFLSIGVQNPIALFIQTSVAIGIILSLSRYVIQLPNPENEGLNLVIKEIGFVVNELNEIKAAEDLRPTKDLSHASSSARGYSEVTGKKVVVGLDSDLEGIKARLTRGSNNHEVVPIVGMGGIGKTTLARQVFDDNYIGHHFDARAWITISQQYSLHQILIGLLNSMKIFTEDMNKKKEAELSDSLHKCLKDRRYLVVLDDVWDTNIWDKVRVSFPEDGNGSRVLLTTRLEEVAFYANSGSSPHQMHLLNHDKSWNLLCSKVFGDKECPRELKQIGEEIAENCKGLPLAIAVIGGLLSNGSSTQEYWGSVGDNLNSVVTKDEDQCMKILSLSYNHLPHRLRPCFLYMAAFPEDCEIPVSKLIRLWAAEGFIESYGSKSIEDLAEEYLIDLVQRNLVMVCKKCPIGKIKSCNVHDLLRYMCLQKAQKEEFLYVVKCFDDVVKCYDDVVHNGKSTIRRFSINAEFMGSQSKVLYESRIHKSVTHSLLCTGADTIDSYPVYLDHKLLRVLDLIKIGPFYSPEEIVTLVNLRYLAFTCYKVLPPHISQLRNLETLVCHISIANPFPFLPREIWTMPKLTHLCVTPGIICLPLDTQSLANTSLPLENLQTLSKVSNVRFSKDILERIPNLKTLKVSYDSSPRSVWFWYELEALVNLHQLETLEILINFIVYPPEINYLPKLAFPHSLRRLTLNGCLIPWSYMKVIGALPNLEVLKLRNYACQGSEWEPVEEEFCQLKYLLLEKLDLVQWSADETHFPRLERLIIKRCRKLEEIPPGIGEIPTLELIELVDCLPSVVTSVKQIEEEQKDLGNEKFKVHIELSS